MEKIFFGLALAAYSVLITFKLITGLELIAFPCFCIGVLLVLTGFDEAKK